MEYLKKATLILAGLTTVVFFLVLGVLHAEASGCPSAAAHFENNPSHLGYGTKEQARIECRFAELEAKIKTLENMNWNLRQKVEGIQGGTTVIQPERVIETREIVRDPDNERVEALEKRVGRLESAMAFLYEKVVGAVNVTIDLLRQLIDRL